MLFRSQIGADLPALAQSIKEWGRELGFQQVAIAGLDLGEHEHHLQRWLDAGYHGDMEYMGAHGSKRSHPEELVPGTLRVVSLRMDYLPGDTHMAQLLAQPEKAYISRYALGRDYHKLIRKRVQQLADRIQPRPACWAMAFSSTGALSTNARKPNGPMSAWIRSASCCTRLRISLW